MNKYIGGVPIVLIFFVLALLVPILAADVLLYHAVVAVKKPVVMTQTVVTTPMPTATPSAALSPTKAFKSTFVVTPTTAVVKPAVTVVK